MNKGAAQLLQILVVITIGILIIFVAFPSLKDNIFNYFKNIPQVAVTASPIPISTQTPSPTPKPVPTKTPGTPKPSVTPRPATPTPGPVVTSNELPKSGYSSFYVKTDTGTFKIAMGGADIATTKVVVDTASDSDCTDNCPALALGTYVSRRNAYAGINGTYFCPPGYTSCSGVNSFNFLVMNINKTYFNSSMNVYSTNPGVIISSNYVRFVGQIQEWGRDTSPDMVLSNYPMLVQGGNIAYAGSSDSKITIKTTRSFIANKGNTVYIGDVFGASTEDAAHVLHTLGVDNALNLDDAGSAAFWWGGYKVGPGRNIPNAILFIQR